MNKRQFDSLVSIKGWWNAYSVYLNSSAWKRKRKQVLKRDNNECQTCRNEEGYPLEVHHRRGHSNVPDDKVSDLVTLCKSCHLAITNNDRARRYKQNNINPNYVDESKKEELINYGMESNTIRTNRCESVDSAQREFGQSYESDSEGTKSNLWEEGQDRSRFRGIG